MAATGVATLLLAALTATESVGTTAAEGAAASGGAVAVGAATLVSTAIAATGTDAGSGAGADTSGAAGAGIVEGTAGVAGASALSGCAVRLGARERRDDERRRGVAPAEPEGVRGRACAPVRPRASSRPCAPSMKSVDMLSNFRLASSTSLFREAIIR